MMKKFINMLIRNWSGSSVKILLTLGAVALGTGILILTNSAGLILEEQITAEMDKEGLILYVANGEWDSLGKVEEARPTEWDSTAPSVLLSDLDSINFAVPLITPAFNQVTTEGKSYNLRNAVGSGPAYFNVFSLDIIAGNPMTDNDLEMGLKKVWISSEMAELLYGSVDAAVGKWIQPPGEMLNRGRPGGQAQNVVQQYSVTGVFESPSEVTRRSYGIGDMIYPYTALITAGGNKQMMLDMMSAQFVVQADGKSVEKLSSSIRQVLTSNFGDDLSIIIWEGSTRGTSSYMEELRQSVNVFTVSLSILGIVLLLTSSLGIFSIMVVEALNRRKDIALERALGASKKDVIKEFWMWSLTLSLTGAMIGVILSLALAGPVLNTLSPLVGEVSAQFSEAAGIKLLSVFRGVFFAVLFGGVLGILPSFSAVKGNIAETLREA
ncbi:ABC transporter permease [Oceanispirochaeta crateris]|uniref:ABC transporter permease n=1 Tax=Oceanispirochaeta crateris TaxID=2518645 RepID=A0A5C1QLW9_9SPIO|nr:ABC transporter permease [Oceanispirochaeta crateris]QEN08209.1 ABC transporter permease [Oceanispirochaeta crateris]